jgi:aminobenzoyl-glutamate utilization protein B
MSNWSGEKGTAAKWVDDNAAEMAEISDKIFSYAEPGLREYKSSKLLIDFLKRNDFDVETGVSGMPTAFTSTWG